MINSHKRPGGTECVRAEGGRGDEEVGGRCETHDERGAVERG